MDMLARGLWCMPEVLEHEAGHMMGHFFLQSKWTGCGLDMTLDCCSFSHAAG